MSATRLARRQRRRRFALRGGLNIATDLVSPALGKCQRAVGVASGLNASKRITALRTGPLRIVDFHAVDHHVHAFDARDDRLGELLELAVRDASD